VKFALSERATRLPAAMKLPSATATQSDEPQRQQQHGQESGRTAHRDWLSAVGHDNDLRFVPFIRRLVDRCTACL